MQRKGLIRRKELILEFMTSQPRKQAIAIHILPNISRNKGNQTLKFGQPIDYYMRDINFLKNHTQNLADKLSPKSFLKKQN